MDSLAKLNTGLIITVIGVGVVFAVLVFLSYTFKLLEIVLRYRQKIKSHFRKSAAQSDDAIPGIGDIAGFVAVITAAVLSCMSGKTRFVVRSITRVGDPVPVWGKTGRHDQMTSRVIK